MALVEAEWDVDVEGGGGGRGGACGGGARAQRHPGRKARDEGGLIKEREPLNLCHVLSLGEEVGDEPGRRALVEQVAGRGRRGGVEVRLLRCVRLLR